MLDKKELIEISGTLDIRPSFCSFYEFASNYIFNIKEKGSKNSADFFKTVSDLSGNLNRKSNRTALGISGSDTSAARTWCEHITRKAELKKLSLDELHYVMGYCARRCKIMKN